MTDQLLFADRDLRFGQLRLLEAPALAARVNGGIVDVAASTLRWLEDGARSLAEEVGDLRVDEVAPQQIMDWHRSLLLRMKPVTANSYLRSLKTLFGRLLKAGVVAINPARPVPFATEPPPSPTAIRESDYLALRGAAEHIRDRAIVDMLWATGCRLGGLISMQVDRLEIWQAGDDIRMAAVVVEKFRRPRHVYARSPQTDSLIAWLEVRPDVSSSAVFLCYGARSRNKPLAETGVQHVLRNLRLRAGVSAGSHTNAHAFRHAFAIRQLDAGHDLAAVSAWLGHSDPAFTAKVYAKRREDELRRKFFGE